MHIQSKISLNGTWKIDWLSAEPYTGDAEPAFPSKDCITPVEVPGYWEDQLDAFRTTALHTKVALNPLYTLQRYPQAGYVPDMALPTVVGCFVYKRTFSLEKEDTAAPAELYVGGVQNALSAWINGVYLGRHEGYSAEFFLKIPADVLRKGENTVTLAVSNNRLAGYMDRPVSGLTSRAANECTGGIYGDVEIRSYADGLRDLWVSSAKDLSSFTVHISPLTSACSVTVLDGTKILASATLPAGETSLTLPAAGYALWSPSSPKLYTVRVQSESQSAECRFGIRSLTVQGTKLYMNGEPYFFRGTCEHCYHPITVHPTREKNYYRRVLRTLKELGFNSIRFHTYVPMMEYLEAADELGMVMEVETPNNTTYEEWLDIVRACRHYTSALMYSSGNEMVIDEDYIEHLRACAKFVHEESDALFSPMSAMRGVEYYLSGDLKAEPFSHNPGRLAKLGEFCDVYNAYSLGQTSYSSEKGDPALLDYRNSIYGKPLLTHEICIQGTYCDLSLKDRYRGSRIGDTEFMSSVEKHLEAKGLLDRAPLYYRNSAAWQRILRKHCFETVRRTHTFAGYDFLGDIDTHWHTFGYCVGMMNEFYELKPGETPENVRRYNSDTVLLADLPRCLNYEAGTRADIPLLVSNYGKKLEKAVLRIRVSGGTKVLLRRELRFAEIPAGEITPLCTLALPTPRCEDPMTLKLNVTLTAGDTDAENEWEIFVFPKAARLPSAKDLRAAKITVTSDIDGTELMRKMAAGESVVLFGTGPFAALETNFQLSVAGRTNGHLATVVADHPLMEKFPHEGFCSWQFREMLNGAKAAVLDLTRMPHDPIVDIASTYKNAHREAMLFEYRIGAGRLLVCTLRLNENDPGARWLKAHIHTYAMSDAFCPKTAITGAELALLCTEKPIAASANTNEAMNLNDITMKSAAKRR